MRLIANGSSILGPKASLLALVAALGACRADRGELPTLPRSQTFAELRTVRRAVIVTAPDEPERGPYPRERLVDGEVVRVDAGGLAWLRRDGGATLLVQGPADLTLRSTFVELRKGRVFIDTPSGATSEIATPAGRLHLAHVRASLSIDDKRTTAYVLAGEVRTDGAETTNADERAAVHAGPGERLVLEGDKATTSPALAWDDWTGGLATTDRAAEPSPYGVGTIGARRPGDQGAPRFPLAIQKLDVRVTIDHDLAITEVEELFFNPSSEIVEGIYRFRTPEGATLHRFGVDRDGVTVWGRVKEKQAAAAQYQANVYKGSTEDPALLEWDAPGVYRARLYPIGPGDTRRVTVRYAEWLGRSGKKGERRLYVYPMAAEGAEASLPHVEELGVRIDLAQAGAKDVRVGMAGVHDGSTLVVRAHDLVPRADLAVELFDDGLTSPRGYLAPHVVDTESLPPSERAEAVRRAQTEADYVLVPVRAADVPLAKGGLDLAIVVDTSAATESASLAIARAATAALLAHLGEGDRVAVWTGDASLRPVAGSGKLEAVDEASRRAILTGLATADRGGATDLGEMLSEAAASLDPNRRGAVVYIGDGMPTVGELGLSDLKDRLAKLPRPVRVFSLGVGDGADMSILKGLARGAFAERVSDSNAAARAALRLLEEAERPVWLGASIDLGPRVERVFPRDLSAMVADESVLVVGRVVGGTTPPTELAVTGPSGRATLPLTVSHIDDEGDLRRRWAEGRLAQMIDEGTGHAAMVDLGSRHGIITPVTSLYVPTKNEMTPDERSELERRAAELQERGRSDRRSADKQGSSDSWSFGRHADKSEAVAENNADNKEGGTGTRAKGEEGSMGSPQRQDSNMRFGVRGPPDNNFETTPSKQLAPSPPMAPPAGVAAATPPPPPARGGAGPAAKPAAHLATPQPVEKKTEARSAADSPSPSAAASANRTTEAPADAIPAPLNEAPAEFGMIGLLQQNQPYDGEPAMGNLWGADIGASGGNGLPLSGIGEGGGGRGDGIGLGNVGTIGHGAGTGTGQGFGSGHGRLGGDLKAKTPKIVGGPVRILDDEQTKNSLGKKGKEGEREKAKTAADRPFVVEVRIGDVPHASFRCGGAAFVSFDERVGLWRERLARATGNAGGVASVYRSALASCEAPTWRERSKLLSMLLDAMPAVAGKVALWRTMFKDLGAADSIYRGILARVRTPAEARQLHDALGLKSFDPAALEKLIAEAKTPAERVKKLRALFAAWPDDFALALRLLDVLEDEGDDGAGRELAKQLRARPDADARLRTAVGEFYLRARTRDANEEAKAFDEAEAKRAFGEIVEFAPEDPIARRRLGDLLRAHGWFEAAMRQYETLAKLAPDDPSVSLLLAGAAEGLGRLEEAVKWTEKGGAAGAPDVRQGPAVTARALSTTYLAWGLEKARHEGKADEAKAVEARLHRVLAADRSNKRELRGPRVSLTWAHPELHPTLWSNALGAPMPAPEGDVTLGVAEVVLPPRSGAFVEVRVEKDELEHAARLGAEAVLTVLFEDGDDEKVLQLPVRFERGGKTTKRFAVEGLDVKEVTP